MPGGSGAQEEGLMEDRTQEASMPLPRKWTLYKLLGTRRETYWI